MCLMVVGIGLLNAMYMSFNVFCCACIAYTSVSAASVCFWMCMRVYALVAGTIAGNSIIRISRFRYLHLSGSSFTPWLPKKTDHVMLLTT